LIGFAAKRSHFAIPSGIGAAYVKLLLIFGGLAFAQVATNHCHVFRFVFGTKHVAGAGLPVAAQ
jgi:hypothetical protein